MRLLITISGLLAALNAFSQWECRSNLSGHMKPIKPGSDFSWGAEINGSSGYLTNSSISNSMLFIGMDYYHIHHQVYFEGGFKYWNKYDSDLPANFSKLTPGLREITYNYVSPEVEIKAGLHAIKPADYFLVNERAWGTSISSEHNGWLLQFNAATVTKDFARNGTFCSNCFLYDIVTSRDYPLGNNWGETNFAAFSFNRKTSTTEIKTIADNTDEPEEFEAFNPDTDNHESKKFLNSYGGILYAEFGGFYSELQVYSGLTAEFNLGHIATFKTEGVYQSAPGNNALLYFLEAVKVLHYSSGDLSTFQVTYIGKKDIDADAAAMPRFSNLFLGEVLRMSTADIPVLNLSAKHQFINHQISLKLQYTKQIKGLHMTETDFSAGKYFFNKHLRTTIITGLMKSDELTGTSKLAKLEMRLFF